MNACSQCASLLRAGARFCGSCGAAASVEESDQDAPPAPSLPAAASAASPAEAAPVASPFAAANSSPAPTSPAFVTYAPLPDSTPPHDDSSPDVAPPLAPLAAPPPAPAAPALRPGTPPGPSAAPAPAPRPPVPPPAPQVAARARERWSDGRLVAIAVTAVLLVGSLVAALVLSGGSDEPKPMSAKAARGISEPGETAPPEAKRPSSTAEPEADLRSQVKMLDNLMKASQKGRAAAVKGETDAAIANRSKLLKDLQRLRSEAGDAQLRAGLGSFTAAIRESLRQNRECADACSATELNNVNRLKQQAVVRLNPLLRKYAKTTYRSRDI